MLHETRSAVSPPVEPNPVIAAAAIAQPVLAQPIA
jgi:hypothetical protein